MRTVFSFFKEEISKLDGFIEKLKEENLKLRQNYVLVPQKNQLELTKVMFLF